MIQAVWTFFRCVAFVLLGLLPLSPPATYAQTEEFRAYWVDAFHAGFMDSNQVTTMVNDARAGNFNALIVEVRKRGDAYYNSNFEPKATDVSPQSFDPLADLIAKAHDTSGGQQRLEVHAWMVTYHIWNPAASNGVPAQPTHPYNLHPDWLMKDVNGATYIGGQYTFDQGHPGVQQHTYNVAMDIVSNYDIDGINFDYVRYSSVNEGYNPVTVARFNELSGGTGQPSPTNAVWKQFRRDQITGLVRKIYLNTIAIKPHVKVSADTICFAPGVTNLDQWYSSSAAWNSVLQDWRGWMEEGILDMAVPMAYFRQNTVNSNDWANWSIFSKDFKYDRHVAIGPGIYLNSISNSIYQIRSTRDLTTNGNRAEGVSLYSYAVVDAIANAGNLQTQLVERALFQSAITTNGASVYDPIAPGVFSQKVGVPPMPWKTTPTRGHVKGFIFHRTTNSPIDGASVTLAGPSSKIMTNDATGFYGAVELVPGNYTLTAMFSGLDPVSANITIEPGIVATLDFILTDGTAPGFAGIVVTDISNTSVTIKWNTDENASTIVEYGPTSDYGLVFSNSVPVSNHVAQLSDLFPCSTYHFRVRSVDSSTNVAVSEDAVFSTAPAGVVNDIIVDNPEAGYSGLWTVGTVYPDKFGSYYQYALSVAGNAMSEVVYRPNIRVRGKYNVHIWYPQGVTHTTNAQILIFGESVSLTRVDQTTGGGGWRLIGALKDFALGTNGFVRILNNTGETDRLVLSDAVRFEFVEAACVASQPQNQTVPAGTNVVFQVVAQGAGTFTYQWFFNGDAIPGATSHRLSLLRVLFSDIGEYLVVVGNLAGSATSIPATLLVLPAAPARFRSASLLSEARIKLSFDGNANVIYRVDGSTNLVNWTPLTNIFSSNGLFEFIDSTATNGQQFYRAVWSP